VQRHLRAFAAPPRVGMGLQPRRCARAVARRLTDRDVVDEIALVTGCDV
jgi:hypothetical protein